MILSGKDYWSKEFACRWAGAVIKKVEPYIWADGWMDGRMDGWTDEPTDKETMF